MLDLSRKGFKQHTFQGWNIGKPPYGYLKEVHPHPVIDPARGPVVTQIFAWRAMERLSYQRIADRLNTDLDRYPPPVPCEKGDLQHRNRSVDTYCGKGDPGRPEAHRVHGLEPPQAQARTRGQGPRQPTQRIGMVVPANPRTPDHSAFFDAARPIGRYRRGSRSQASTNPHPQTERTYRSARTCCATCARPDRNTI